VRKERKKKSQRQVQRILQEVSSENMMGSAQEQEQERKEKCEGRSPTEQAGKKEQNRSVLGKGIHSVLGERKERNYKCEVRRSRS